MSNQAKPAAITPNSQTGRPVSASGMGSAGQSSIAHDRIAKRAYEKWCKRGCPQGSHEQDWYEAETELRAELSGQTAGRAMPSSPPLAQQPVARPAQATAMPQKPVQRR